MKYYKTSQVAKIAGVHPNTVRLYEEWGLLQPTTRGGNGYRIYTEHHVEQMRLARIALRCDFVEGNIRKRARALVKASAGGQMEEARKLADEHLLHIQDELNRAEEALELIEQQLKGLPQEEGSSYVRRADVAKLLDVSIDVLRNWERNGLIHIPRSLENQYRIYGTKEIHRLKVIRTLRSANYSMMAILRMLRHIDEGGQGDLREIINTPSTEEDIIGATDRWISALIQSKQDAKEAALQLERMRDLQKG